MTSKKKKVFILIGMVALLVLTGVLNIVLNNSGPLTDAGGSDVTYSNYFEAYRAERLISREQSFLYYDTIITSSESSAEAVAAAQASKLKLTEAIETERVLEWNILALGFEDVVISNTTENINVIVKCDEMTSTQSTQIYQIIMSEINDPSTYVRIIPA